MGFLSRNVAGNFEGMAAAGEPARQLLDQAAAGGAVPQLHQARQDVKN